MSEKSAIHLILGPLSASIARVLASRHKRLKELQEVPVSVVSDAFWDAAEYASFGPLIDSYMSLQGGTTPLLVLSITAVGITPGSLMLASL